MTAAEDDANILLFLTMFGGKKEEVELEAKSQFSPQT